MQGWEVKRGRSELAGRWRSAFTVESLAIYIHSVSSPGAQLHAHSSTHPPPDPPPGDTAPTPKVQGWGGRYFG